MDGRGEVHRAASARRQTTMLAETHPADTRRGAHLQALVDQISAALHVSEAT